MPRRSRYFQKYLFKAFRCFKRRRYAKAVVSRKPLKSRYGKMVTRCLTQVYRLLNRMESLKSLVEIMIEWFAKLEFHPF